MSHINIYKIEDEKQQAFLQTLATNWDRKATIIKERHVEDEDIDVGLTLYMMTTQEEKPMTWNWILTAFNETEITSIPNPKAIVIVENRENIYAVTFGYSYFIVDKYCDQNFAFDFARRLDYSEIKTTTLTTPSSQRNKTVNTYTQYSNFDFDSGESFAKIKAKARTTEDFTLYNEEIEVGNSIRFSVETNSLDNIVDLILHVEDTIAHQQSRVDFPVFQKITDKDEVCELDVALQTAIDGDEYRISFSEIDIIGSTEVFNHNDATYQIKYKGREKTVAELTQARLQEFADEYGWNLNSIVLELKVVLFRNGEPICTKSIREIIDYTVSERKSILSKGIWYKYNDDYLRYLSLSIKEIDAKYLPDYDFHQAEHDAFIELKYASEKDNEEYLGKSQAEVRKCLKNKYYSERFYNIRMSERHGFQLYDRCNVRIETADVELMDLYKDNCMYAVKIGKSSEKLCYVVDQSIQAIKVYKHNLTNEKPPIDQVAIIIILERATHLPIENGKPDINMLDMLTLKNKFDYWKKEVRILGYKPVIYINYKSD